MWQVRRVDVTEERRARLAKVARQFRTDEGAAKVLGVTTEVLVERCREHGIETPAVWHRRLRQVFKEMAAKRV